MTPPSTIAHYRIVSKLGEGGMGAVYRATDTKLNREVAVKILPDSYAQDPDRMARFTREAQVLAGMNHPNIAAIYGVEERALVLELVEGETLADRIARGPIPLDEARDIARQIAGALEYAHEKGIIHRDFKPANVKVTPEGRVKVLDFGLAKALLSDSPSTADLASSPTLTMRATMAGAIMGTAAYMSPEQAKGKPVDRRADIWAFGVVFVEMLSGRQLYGAETVSETLAAVLMKDVDLSGLPPKTPTWLPARLRRCLERDPMLRLRDIGEARIMIERPPAIEAAAAPAIARHGVPWPVAVVVPLAVATILGFFLWRASTPPDRPLMRFSIDLGPDAVAGMNTTVAVSPDGTRIVYPVRAPGGTSQLAIRLLAESKVTLLNESEGAADPFFSPDSQWVGFSEGQRIRKVSVQGGAAVTVCSTIAALRGASWGADDNIVFGINLRTNLLDELKRRIP